MGRHSLIDTTVYQGRHTMQRSDAIPVAALLTKAHSSVLPGRQMWHVTDVDIRPQPSLSNDECPTAELPALPRN